MPATCMILMTNNSVHKLVPPQETVLTFLIDQITWHLKLPISGLHFSNSFNILMNNLPNLSKYVRSGGMNMNKHVN